MENPSLRVNGHGGSLNRPFIVEDCSEDDFGQWATDEMTDEHGYIDDEKSCFCTWDDNEYAWQSRPFKKKHREKMKANPKGPEEHFLEKKTAQDPQWWSEKDFALWSKRKKGKKGLSKGNDGFQKGGFALISHKKM